MEFNVLLLQGLLRLPFKCFSSDKSHFDVEEWDGGILILEGYPCVLGLKCTHVWEQGVIFL